MTVNHWVLMGCLPAFWSGAGVPSTGPSNSQFGDISPNLHPVTPRREVIVIYPDPYRITNHHQPSSTIINHHQPSSTIINPFIADRPNQYYCIAIVVISDHAHTGSPGFQTTSHATDVGEYGRIAWPGMPHRARWLSAQMTVPGSLQ